MSQIIGGRSTYQASSGQEDRLVRQVADEISLLEPDATPLLTLTMRLKKRKPAKASKFEWFEDDYVARWGAADGTGYNSAATTIGVADSTVFVPGDLFQVPKTIDDATAPEVLRVLTIVDGTHITVARNVGGGAAASIPANAPLRIIGPAYEEGAAPPSAKSTSPTKKTGYLQIFRTECKFTKTAIATEVYGAPGGERKREHMKKLVEHKQKMNSALLFGRASEDLTGGPSGNPIRTTGGVIAAIQSNITDAGGTLTRKVFEAFSRQSFRYGAKKKFLLAAPIVKSAINEWAKDFLLVKPSETKFGVNIQQVETAHGIWMLANDWMLENQGTYGYGGMALSIDLDKVTYMYLNNNGEDRDTKITQDIVKDGSDQVVDEILTEGGYKIEQEKWHARLNNVGDYV